ncbi:ATP-binding cassette domain-containing protein [Photobacterium sp. OFAV2-7]|uniref:ABC transporter ATP-binding protein n=1 Tax=Photobacterium sp. OFAV2-7 TaxID=2917748 RepID=UPI001EF66F4C|nr:ATP-binding cassette domain-containing protein [Photobacterium sp. OFAV2-7]
MIEFQKIHKNYHLSGQNVHEALKGVHGVINRGEIIALFGPSGSGKSSLLNICSLLDSNYNGRVIIDGEAITKTPEFALDIRRKKIGLIYPGFSLVTAYTVFENIEFPLVLSHIPDAIRRDRVTAMMSTLELDKYKDDRPEQLTEGLKRRVLVARAFINQPVAVFADEPVADLDSRDAASLIEMIKRIGKETGSSVLIATCDSDLAVSCGRIIHLQNGNIVEHVPRASIQRSKVSEALPWGI